jgi:uncharacterized membrane protein
LLTKQLLYQLSYVGKMTSHHSRREIAALPERLPRTSKQPAVSWTPTVVSRPLLIAIVLAIAVMSALAVVRWNIWSYGSDTGTFAQAVANTAHGFSDNIEPGHTHFSTHWSPILALLWPIVALTRSPLSLQLVQVVLVICAALPLAAIVAPYAGAGWAARVGILAVLYPPLLANAFSEFHELAFYPVLALALIWAADRARWAWFLLFAVLLVTIREDACIDLAVIGAILAGIGFLRRHTRERGLLLGEPLEPERLAVAGLGLCVLSIGVLAIYAFAILPRIGAWAPSHFYEYPFAHGPMQTAAAVFVHPIPLLRAIATTGRLTYLLEAFVPLAFLPLFSRWTWLALPAFAGILLASDQSVWRMGMHYVLLWAPWMLLGGSWALVRFSERSEQIARRWWSAAIALCAIFLVAFNPMHPLHYLTREPYQRTALVRAAFSCVPKEAPVATHDEWFAHEALAYPHSGELGRQPAGFRGYLVYTTAYGNPDFTRTLPAINAALRRGTLVPVCRFGDVRVLRSTDYRS